MRDIYSMNETFWGLFETQISALRNCESPDEANFIMLETAKFLMENIDLSESTMDLYDKFGLRKLFAAHNALGGSVVSFYEVGKNRLDPVALNGSIGQKITMISEQITSTIDAMNRLQELEKNLIGKEAELRATEKELNGWEIKVSELQDIAQNAEAEIQGYQDQYKQLEKIVEKNTEELRFWEAHLGEDSSIVDKMKECGIASLTELLAKIEILKTNIKQDLKMLDTVIKKVIVQEEQVRDAVLRKQNKIV